MSADLDTKGPLRKPVLQGENLSKSFWSSTLRLSKSSGEIRAVDHVTFTLEEGETLGIVGESGSGKSTLARLILGLEDPSSGVVSYRGKPVVQPGSPMPRKLRREIQFVAQDPFSNLDPRMKIGRIVSEGWRVHADVLPRSEWDREAIELLARVGVSGEDVLGRYPREFSGGQRQRIALARALALRPSVLILDEPISSLDVSVQAQVLRLLQDLQNEQGLAYVFIAHDLSVVEYFATSVAVMYRGRIVEKGPAKDVFAHPRHPYTDLLRNSSPQWTGSGRAVINAPNSLGSAAIARLNEACVFSHRCPFHAEKCAIDDPHDHWVLEGAHRYACHFPLKSDAQSSA